MNIQDALILLLIGVLLGLHLSRFERDEALLRAAFYAACLCIGFAIGEWLR